MFTETAPPAPAATLFSRKNPFPSRLLVRRKLDGPGSEKETFHYEYSLEESGLVYEVGDSLGVFPANAPELVEETPQPARVHRRRACHRYFRREHFRARRFAARAHHHHAIAAVCPNSSGTNCARPFSSGVLRSESAGEARFLPLGPSRSRFSHRVSRVRK